MNKYTFYFIALIFVINLSGCTQKKDNNNRKEGILPLAPQYEAKYDRSTPISLIDIEQAITSPSTSLKLSQIASEIEYYRVGDANFTVKQAIAIPDSNAFLTFNKPRIYYRKQHIPSKRYGFKALDYKWNNDMNGQNLFYDKASTHLYCALSGKDKTHKENDDPYIGKLPPLDTMLTIFSYIYPEMLETKYPLRLKNDKLLGFSSKGYVLCHYEQKTTAPNGIITFKLEGDTLCKFQLRDVAYRTDSLLEKIPHFQTSYWNETQDKMTFMIPFCDTIYQLIDKQTVKPIYNIYFGELGLSDKISTSEDIDDKKLWLRTLYENPKGIFMGLYQKKGSKILNWLGWEDSFKPVLTQQAVFLKETGKTYLLNHTPSGFINDLDGGLPFWPDGQTDNYLYMIRTVTEMRETVQRTHSPKQKKLIEFLDDKKVLESDYVMIVIK